MKTVSLIVIAICYLANTVDVYRTDDNGLNIFVGNFGYHIAANNNNK